MNILHPDWPDAKWSVSGYTTHDDTIVNYLTALSSAKSKISIASVHGSPPLLWNGGRTTYSYHCSMQEGLRFLRSYNNAGIGVNLTFSNHYLTEEDLDDKVCNEMLQYLNDDPGSRNGVILSSPLLLRYLNEKFPKLNTICSITALAGTTARSRNTDFYSELASKFDRVVIHPDDNHNDELLSALDPDVFEILVNEHCILNCPIRKEHYDLVASDNKSRGNDIVIHNKLKCFEASTCVAGTNAYIGQHRLKKKSCLVSYKRMKELYDMGYRNFKLQGRTDNLYTFIFDLCRYTLDPEEAQYLVHKFLVDHAKTYQV